MTAAVRFVIGTVLAVLLSALFPVEVHAQKVALLHADLDARAQIVRSKLVAAGLTDVTVIDVSINPTGTTPTLAQLQQYHAIFTYSMFGYLNRDVLGSTLADYVDQGGGVVQAVFSFDAGGPSPGGRWESEHYSVFTSDAGVFCQETDCSDMTLVRTQPTHPILDGTPFDNGGFNVYSPIFGQASSDIVAHWTNGFPAVATRQSATGGSVAGLNFFPALGEGGPLMVKAIQFVAADFLPNPDGPAVALLAAGGASAGVNDVRRKLRGLTLFSRVDVIDVATVPALSTLSQYDALLAWSSSPYSNPAAIGDVLADYVDLNGGVVEAVFGSDLTPGMHLQGRWNENGYRPLTLGIIAPEPSSPLNLVADLPGHAMLSGVTSFSGGTSSVHTMSVLDAATTLVASWNNTQPLAAFGTKPSGGRVVGLNMYPPSSDAASDLWDRNTDGARLIANALLFAANHFPTADAGADQSAGATSASGVTFTLNASASDLDADPLTYNWSGYVTATGPSIDVTVPPPTGAQSHAVTLQLTVSDGKGGEATDTIELTVTDFVAPVLHNMPTGTITAEATSDSGATVAYGPVTAIDAVDGPVTVTCSHAGVFPVGDTAVTCSAADSRGNSASASFTVQVTPVPEPGPAPAPDTPGRMNGHGFIRHNHRHHEFSFFVAENGAGDERGSLLMTVKSTSRASDGYRRRVDRFVSTTVTSVTFGDDCTMTVAGSGRWNGRAGYRFEATAADKHARRRAHDAVRITITSPGGEVVAHVEGRLDGGNIHHFHKTY